MEDCLLFFHYECCLSGECHSNSIFDFQWLSLSAMCLCDKPKVIFVHVDSSVSKISGQIYFLFNFTCEWWIVLVVGLKFRISNDRDTDLANKSVICNQRGIITPCWRCDGCEKAVLLPFESRIEATTRNETRETLFRKTYRMGVWWTALVVWWKSVATVTAQGVPL